MRGVRHRRACSFGGMRQRDATAAHALLNAHVDVRGLQLQLYLFSSDISISAFREGRRKLTKRVNINTLTHGPSRVANRSTTITSEGCFHLEEGAVRCGCDVYFRPDHDKLRRPFLATGARCLRQDGNNESDRDEPVNKTTRHR